MLRELRYALRSLLREKGYSATVFLTLAVCIAANAAAYAIVSCVLLKPLPVPNAARLVLISNQYPKAGVKDNDSSAVADYYERLHAVPALSREAMFQERKGTLSIESSPRQIPGMAVTPSFFPLIGVNPARGRAFTPEEGEIGAENKVILSDALWHSLFAASPGAIGQDVRINGRPFTVVGIMPAGFNFVDPDVRYWVPLAFTADQKSQHHNNNWHNIGLLVPGATIRQVQSQVDALNAANLDRFPQFKQLLINAGYYSNVQPLQAMVIKDVGSSLWLLWGGALLVLLIGAVNLINVAVARWTARRKEIATRLALGGSRTQLLSRILAESLLVSMAGCAAGIAAAAALPRILTALDLDRFPRAGEVHVDLAAAAVAIALSLLVAILMAIVPLYGLLRLPVSAALREDGRSGTSGVRTRFVRQSLVGAEIAFAFVLLAGAGLLLASFRNLLAVDPGFTADRVVTGTTSLPSARYPDNKALVAATTREIEAIRRAPGVVSAGITSNIPFGGNYSNSVIFAEGYTMGPGESVISPQQLSVSPGYLETMKIGLVRGRLFNEHDVDGSLPVILVDEELARHFWPGQNPIGRRMYQPQDTSNLLKTDEHTKWTTVVGVVRSVRMRDLAGSGGIVGAYYFPLAQSPARTFTFAIRSSASAEDAERSLRSAISRIDPELAVFDLHTMTDRASLSIASRRTSVMLAIGFGVIALMLAAIGIYGVLVYLVTQRRREIGIRIALGSTALGVVRLILADGVRLTAGGLLAGLIGFAALNKTVSSQVYGIGVLDPEVIAAVAVLLGAIALMACLIPARKAAKVNPAIVLSE
jgi:predicted permease